MATKKTDTVAHTFADRQVVADEKAAEVAYQKTVDAKVESNLPHQTQQLQKKS